MQIGELLDRSAALEERTGRLYRKFAAAARNPELAQLWAELADEEALHLRAVRDARARMRFGVARRTRVDGWDEALADVEARLEQAEALGPDATPDDQLCAALHLEASEIDVVRRAAMAAAATEANALHEERHAHRLAEAARRLSSHPQVQLAATALLARERLAGG
jgi:rubrerythrin